MSSHDRDRHRNLILSPAGQGRVYFWHGKPIWTNPFKDLQGREFADAWWKAEAGFQAAGGVTDEDRVRLRPVDLPPPQRVRKVMVRGMAKRRRAARVNTDFDWNATV